tara:strand:+ start:305 stop:538 length:234 start_codon:yes stop_codon:yes gene_type:complete
MENFLYKKYIKAIRNRDPEISLPATMTSGVNESRAILLRVKAPPQMADNKIRRNQLDFSKFMLISIKVYENFICKCL